jgi:hypothetical protein
MVAGGFALATLSGYHLLLGGRSAPDVDRSAWLAVCAAILSSLGALLVFVE